MTLDSDAARECVATEHADVVAAVGACADAVADSRDGLAAGDGTAVAAALESCLDKSGTLGALPGVLAAAVDAAGGTLSAEPVAAPPYVAVTSRGPVLRATLDDGRLVVELRAIRLTDDNGYERRDGVAVEASVR
ncbi:hypothetical protein [Halobacterium rubrum]|uniref:hypothetical protein n=1 Tax=Halobacterium TaxID=2239 RepID=UPI001F21240E|nr:hypothetical protein [Halobacterium rubrum]MDH5019198.1 hypothetical protein [Halobacterium rubrum]